MTEKFYYREGYRHPRDPRRQTDHLENVFQGVRSAAADYGIDFSEEEVVLDSREEPVNLETALESDDVILGADLEYSTPQGRIDVQYGIRARNPLRMKLEGSEELKNSVEERAEIDMDRPLYDRFLELGSSLLE